MKPNIGISEKNLESITSLLSVLLADETVFICQNKEISLECSRQKFYGNS